MDEAEGMLFEYEIDPEPLVGGVTNHAGLPLVLETFRALGGMSAVSQHVQIKQRVRGYGEGELIEATVALLAAGGDCLDDYDLLRGDVGLARMLGHGLPSSSRMRQFLYAFHDEALMSQRPAPEQALSWVAPESERLQGLGQVVVGLVRNYVKLRPAVLRCATIDMDASLTESHKREAYAHYQGGRGYQPEVAYWAEADMIVADEFRDGNVPAGKDPLGVVQRGFAALPEGVQAYAFRGDSACYEHHLLNWLRDPQRAGGPRGRITFAISADMTPALRSVIMAVPEEHWQALHARAGGPESADTLGARDWTEVIFVPAAYGIRKDTPADRYLVVRVRSRQPLLFDDGQSERYFAIVTNHEGPGDEVLHWHREKAGTIEHVHHVLKNELAAGTMPCGRFGANAAWYRLNVLTYNVLSAFKQLGLPAELHRARPKKLRFRFFCLGARLASHAGCLWLKLASSVVAVRELCTVRRVLRQALLTGLPTNTRWLRLAPSG